MHGQQAWPPKWPHAGTTVPPVLVSLGKNQYTTSKQANRNVAKIRDPSKMVKEQNFFLLLPNKPGASHFTVQAVTSLVDILIVYSMLIVETKGKA